jgi:RNA polymerase sigma-70 factor, ECF subfamily
LATSILELNPQRAVEAMADAGDLEFIGALREGSEKAYEALLLRFQQPVYNLALRLLDDPTDAADVVQEVFLKVFRNVGHFRGQSSLKTWIFRIAINEAHNQRRWFFRHRHREVGIEEKQDLSGWAGVMADRESSPFEYVCEQERERMIEETLARINPAFRDAVVLRDVMDLSYEEIAGILELSLGTVKSRILRGREALRQKLEERLRRPSLGLTPKMAE